MARKYMERRLSKSHRTTIPTSFKVQEPFEFYNKATPFVQRTLLFVADENSGPKQNEERKSESQESTDETPGTSKSEQEKSPKKSSFFFSPSKSCKIHGRFFRLPSPKKKAEPSDVASNRGAAGGLISYAPGWSLKGEHLMKWQESGKTTIEVNRFVFI
ncbi:unnamed protein product [Pieris brassicae]|uniref:Uncharacterized protein n=1 Tax=Pieris brassicae TaxID=7116 RepID=A0A9P0T8U3_PIEBR|nr:unnamed protein product [Pieris brassicae]